MWDLVAITEGLNLLGFPLLAIAAMFASKLTVSAASRLADRCFMAMFAIQCLITARTVIISDTAWLVHMATLGLLIVGTFVIPSVRYGSQDAVGQGRL